MVKTVLSTSHQGLREWWFQRVSAIVMTVYVLGMMIFLVTHPVLNFSDWYQLFSNLSMKVITLLVLLSLMYHSWVGIWTVLTDYIKPFILRLFLNILVFLALIAFFFAGLFILWGM